MSRVASWYTVTVFDSCGCTIYTDEVQGLQAATARLLEMRRDPDISNDVARGKIENDAGICVADVQS